MKKVADHGIGTDHTLASGNLKTLTHSPRTPTMDGVHGLSVRTDQWTTPTGPPTHHPKIEYKTKMKILISASLIDQSCRQNFERYTEKNITHLGSVNIRHHYILAIFFAVALHERSGSLRNFMLYAFFPSAILFGSKL